MPERKRPAHPPPLQRFDASVILFLTVCVAPRRDLLANPTVAAALPTAWAQTSQWVVGYYMIMPDHVHLFCAPGVYNPEPVASWVKYWKRLAGIAVPSLRGSWQADCWDTQMRTQEQYIRKVEYVEMNPVRQELVAAPADWAYQGHLNRLVWISG